MATLTTLVSFDGDGGAHPVYESLLADANGDLFGTTLSGGATGDGTVFELVNTGSGYSFQTLASLNYTSGSGVFSGLIADANGNLFGTAQSGGSDGYGAVFELANTGSGYTLQTLASFSGANGAYPIGGLVADADGNLFGVTQSGGANSQGSVFELVKTGSGYTQLTLASFAFTDGAAPTGPLIMDAQGDLFGTTLQGGPGNVGTVFELVNTGSGYSLQTLASFHGTDGSYLYAGLTADAQGDLFGTTYSGGAGGVGTVFELVKTDSGYAFQTLASLDYDTTGGLVTGGLVIDAHGDLFGTAQAGGAGGFGTVFELVNTGSGYSLPTVVQTFSGPDGASPKGTLIIDANGNLYGTTAGGGDHNVGTVFEISVGSSSGGDDDSGEQAALALKVNGGSGTPIGAAGANHVAFTVASMESEDTGTVTFTDQANHTVVVQVSAGQTHYVADFSTLTDGAVSASLQVATDPDGASFTPVAGNAVVLDTVAPGQPATPNDAGIDDGYVNAVHDNAGQSIGGTVEAGASVAVYDNGVHVTTVAADGTGAWSYQVGVLADGSSHSYTVTATDAAGNTSAASDALSFTVDASAPAKPGAPGDAAVINGYVNAIHDAAGQTIGGTVEAGASVAVYDNGSPVTTMVADGAGAWSYQVGVLADGSSHSYTVTTTDAAGNTSAASDALNFTVDVSAPAQPATPTDSVVSSGYVALADDTAAQTIGGTAEAGAVIAVYDNGDQVTTVLADGSGAWSYQIGVLAEGSTHSYAVTATDAAGNTSAFSDPLSFTVGAAQPPLDPPNPPAQPAAPADAAVVNGYVNAAHDTPGQTIGGTVDAGALVTLYDHGTQVTTVTADGSGAWSYQIGALADGSTHSYAVTATVAGVASSLSDALNFTVDITAPSAPTGLADAAIHGGFVNKAGDTGGQSLTGMAESGALVTIYDNGTKLGTATANATTGAWTFQLGVLADGVQHLTAAATDAAGNTGAASAPLTFTVDATPPVPFVISVTDAGKGLSAVSGASEAGSMVTVFDSGQQVGVVTAGTDGTWSVSLKLSGSAVHQFTETAVDLAGNAGASAGAAYWTNPPNKSLVGGAADDVFIGQKGDSLTGGAGNDHFVFDAGFGKQTVTDFTSGSDQIWFSHTLFANAASAMGHVHGSGADTVITYDSGDVVTLQGLAPSALHASDFVIF